LTEEVFLRWLPIANAWVQSVNGYGIELRGSALITPPYGKGMVLFNPLNAVASYRVHRPCNNQEAAEVLELSPEVHRRLEDAVYQHRGYDHELRDRLLKALVLPKP